MHPFTKILLQNIRVYAVDQTVQRSADGKEARTVSKTVSLLVTPQQANRITTAENLGEISLIPRHPDDDKIIEDWETDASDIFARSGANNREKERTASEKEGKGLPAMIQGGFNRTASEVDSAFKMKIIYPGEVAEVRFNNETGERLDDSDGYQASGPGTVSMQGAPAPAADGDSEAEIQDADFPIDLNRK